MIYNNLGTSGGATKFFFTWVIQRTIVALVVNILTLEITEHKLYQIVVGILNFDNWPHQQAIDSESMLYIYGKQLRKCWAGQLLNNTFSGQVSHFL